MGKKAIIIGSGFAGISAASFLAKTGWQVTVVEKNSQPGGRAAKLQAHGFAFDMGPSWYWMPDVFERYFQQFGKSVSDYYSLLRLHPSYRIYWADSFWDIPAGLNEVTKLFEKIEPGAGLQLQKVMQEAAFKYEVGIKKLVFKPGQSLSEFLDTDLLKGLFQLDVFTSVKKHISRHFKNKRLQELMEFPVLFLGALPEKTPALYTLMNHADIMGGTWFPEGGMYSIVEAMYQLAEEQGVQFQFNCNVEKINVTNGIATGITASTVTGAQVDMVADVIVSGADYYFTEQKLLEKSFRTYNSSYWEKRVLAPSCLLYYVGINKKLENVPHHSLFFDVPFEPHAADIYTHPQWPEAPLFYVSATSVTDASLAPPGCENLFFLIPVAAGLGGDDEALRNKYFEAILARFEKHIGQSVKEHIIYYKTFAERNFMEDYNSFKGNAYGLANTLLQTAILKPTCHSKKVKNLFFTGQLTVPGPGVPPSLISGEVVAAEVNKHFQ